MKKLIALIASFAMILCFTACGNSGSDAGLDAWTEGGAIDRITEFVEAACDENSDSYIPPEDRISVWDMDGTFVPEYAEDDGFHGPEIEMAKDLAATTLKDDKTAQELLKLYEELEQGFISDHDKYVDEFFEVYDELLAYVFKGCTPEELNDRLQSILDEEFNYGVTYREGAYVPMKQMYEYLTANGFDVYFLSGSHRYVVYNMASAAFNTDEHKVKFSNCIGADSIWEVGDDGVPVTTGELSDLSSSYEGKSRAIADYIGKCPVLCFGNYASIDGWMFGYTSNNPNYKSLEILINHDDEERECAYDAEEQEQACEENGWICVSMKADFAKVFSNEE